MKLLKMPEAFERADVAAHVAPAEQVGGDFFHVFKLPAGKIRGHDRRRLHPWISGGLDHGAVHERGLASTPLESPDPSEVLRKLDDALRDELESTEMFLSVCYVVIDVDAGKFHYSNAGHPHAFVLRTDGEWERLTATDPPVGFAGPDSYGQETAPWRTGDLLLLFTDGLSDTLATPDDGNGELKVLEAVREHANSASARIVEAIFDLADSATPYVPADDRTVVVLRT